ncbi:MAG TPA: hypothetical protein VF748_14875 [Candidatus Acidoferrum sp.]
MVSRETASLRNTPPLTSAAAAPGYSLTVPAAAATDTAGGPVAQKAQITIRVYASRGGSRIQYTSSGRYISFQTAGYLKDLTQQPIQPTANLKTFWAAILSAVQADIAATG